MDDLIASICNEPEKWTLTEHTFNRGKIQIWVCSGVLFVSTYDCANLKFSFRDKFRFWKAFKWWCRNVPARTLCGEDNG